MMYRQAAPQDRTAVIRSYHCRRYCSKGIGRIHFRPLQKYVDEIVTVTDDEISTAILTLIEQQKLIAEGGNVISIHHERASETVDINGCYLRIVMETRNYEHIDKIRSALVEAGYNIS